MNTTKSEGVKRHMWTRPASEKVGVNWTPWLRGPWFVAIYGLQICAPETAASGSLGVEVHCSALAKPRHLANKNDNIYENFNVDIDD